MNCLFITFVAICIANIKAQSLKNKINAYFDSDIVKSFEKKWNSYYIYTFENAIANALREDYGHKTMNVYVNRFHKPLLLAAGYYHTDNQVKLVFEEMVLEALPHLYDVDVSFPLASNLVLVEASVSKMILHTTYVLFRNESDIIFSPIAQDPYKSSPFRFQQVRNKGDLAISIEGCSFSGIIVATLSGNSVVLGHSELRLKDCQYSIEIYKHGSGLPPVIAHYLPKGETGLNLETLLSRAMLEELVPKLQGALFSEVNTSAVFAKDLANIRVKQEVLFDDTKIFMDEVVRDMNKQAIEKNMGTIDLEDFVISWEDVFTGTPAAKSVKLTKMTLLGLDTLYSSHSGGPIRLTEIEIIEQLRFSTLQVVGKVSIEGLQDNSGFAVEISDLAVDVNINMDQKVKFEVLGWRFLEYSCPELELLATESLVVGYLLNEVPKHIRSHLSSVHSGGKVKLNEYYNIMEEQPVDGTYNMKTHEIVEQKQLNDGHVKLHHVKVKSHEEEHDIDQLMDPQMGDSLHIKLYHADDEPHTEDRGPVKLHFVDDDDETPGNGENKKSRKKAIRTKLDMNRKMFTKLIHKPTKRIKFARDRRANKAHLKTVHMSDNEVRSN